MKNIKINENKITIFLDVDGTLYTFKNGTFAGSLLKEKVIKNALSFIEKQLKVDMVESIEILKYIKKIYGDNISIGLEDLYKIPRKVYFDNVWNIEAKDLIKYDKKIRDLIIVLKNNFNIIIVSDAPRVWVTNVLRDMKIDCILKNNIISGEGKYKKSLKNQFPYILKTYNLNPDRCISVGDQENSDIIPAKKIGIKTILVNKSKSKYADFTISDIKEIVKII